MPTTRRFNSDHEISLRHLPDTSNVSFSFQIPNALSGDDCLLDEDDMSFFRDTNDDEVSGPDLKTLTPEKLTRPVSKTDTESHLNRPWKPLRALERDPEVLSTLSNAKVRTQTTQSWAENRSSGITRHEALRAEFEVLKDEAPSSSDPASHTNASHLDEPKAMSSRSGRPAMKTERLRTKAVISGGIVKTQSNKAASVSVPAIQRAGEAQNDVLSDNADLGDADTSVCFTAPGGVAERLVMYSQSLLSSFGPATIHDSDTDPEWSTRTSNAQINAADPHPSPPAAGMPMRQSIKRPASVRCSPQGVAKKRRRGADTSDDGTRSAGTRGSRQKSVPSSKEASAEDLRARRDVGCSGSVRSDKLAGSGSSVQEAGMRAVEFKFAIDARLEARKAEKEKTQKYAEVPDFKRLHAAEEARLALRKENIVPTVPLPFQFSTEERVHERGKFEAHLREKERESKRVLEEKRREEEEMEERAIKELRKKAVPRAHEVPEWYKDVPKRKARGCL
ncbi:hypothetical protein C0989_001328 [Termitomyces sp. Mn162]|nr:hypothetical protein C0989_001328 [Termitomyces sp. Mn162]